MRSIRGLPAATLGLLMVVATACSPVLGRPGAGSAGPSMTPPPPAPSSTASTPAGRTPTSATLFKMVASGVERIDTFDCAAAHVGSGFLIQPDLVATAAHLVQGEGVIRVTSTSSHVVTTATVIGVSPAHDLALLQTSAPLTGHLFTMATSYPALGSALVAVGFPLGGPMQPTRGRVTALQNHVGTDAALSPGNGGGPWLDPDGAVIAIDESGPSDAEDETPTAGNATGVSSMVAWGDFEEWAMDPQPTVAAGCPVDASSERAALDTLHDYFYDIDRADYDAAYAQLGPADRGSYPSFRSRVRGSVDAAPRGSAGLFREDGSGLTSAGQRYVDITYVSRPAADHPGGSSGTCDIWSLRYVFSIEGNVPLIVDTSAQPGHAPRSAC